jgi:large subunit ribosomal protein L32
LSQQPPKPFDVRDIFRDNILWAAVPKKRRSHARKWIRRFGANKIQKFMTPKANLVACLECGSFHERHTICGEFSSFDTQHTLHQIFFSLCSGTCYDKVRQETKALREAMGEDVYKHDAPRSEVAYVYQGEDKEEHSGKFIVEIDRPRPEWFAKNMVSKGHGKYS